MEKWKPKIKDNYIYNNLSAIIKDKLLNNEMWNIEFQLLVPFVLTTMHRFKSSICWFP
jgi:hypothetical protein